MSNEWKDYQRDLRSDFEYNFECALSGVPPGWTRSFMPNLIDELFGTLGSYADEIMFYQIKEKYGQLVVYWNFPDKAYYTEEDCNNVDELIPVVQNIIDKYAKISKNTCIVCGHTTTHITTGYIVPMCDHCEDKF